VPNTVYGKSKWKAEQGLRDIKGLDYVILRPTGVYGPRDKDYFLMAKSIAGHVDFAVGYRRQEITFIYVQDLAEAAISALTKGEKGKAYFLTDGEVYTSRTFSDLLQQEMGVRRVLHITAPVAVLYLVSVLAETFAAWRKKSSTLNTDKYRIMKQRNWQCDISTAQRDLGFAPKFNLKRGVRAAVAWYKQEQWI
jgi:UDP-glucose 4-epimerase